MLGWLIFLNVFCYFWIYNVMIIYICVCVYVYIDLSKKDKKGYFFLK